ncbi:unnamed protein product [Caenorhabditis bovis]|uniref:LITAF domain-containing protein n=1 Tax=Caenorhabditis bovis TaxID=2654633 RepID=A0A8S1EMQ3_9PELO|nr:unnamed protein product [Caenorhabditis bovis]
MVYPDDHPLPPYPQPVKIVKYVPKETSISSPYLDYCPGCQSTIMTRCESHLGVCWWIICFVGFFLFCWPILFFLCCDCSKDIDHRCPNCGLLLATSKKAGF